MSYELQLIATGMVTFRPMSVVFPTTIPSVTFVMMDNPTKRKSVNYPSETIAKHTAFILAEHRNVVPALSSWRPPDLPPNQFGYEGWLLDKERLTLDVPAEHIAFDSSMSEIANIASIGPIYRMDPLYATTNPPSTNPIGAQFYLEVGSLFADGKASKVHFRTSAQSEQPNVTVIRNEVHIEIDLKDDSFSIQSHTLGLGTDPADIRLQFARGQRRMTVYFGSAPLDVLQQIPSGQAMVDHTQDIDFELYYDLTLGGPPSQRPIPHRGGSGPVPGSERCPPLQNL
jgi:hypothetical protein